MPEPKFTAEEEQKLRSLLAKSDFWHSRLEVGEKLVELSAGALRIAPKEGYIALQPFDAATRVRRNAVSLLNEGVSFTVADWSMEVEADREGLQTKRGESTKLRTIKRLRFPILNRESVDQHLPLFTKLTVDAAKTITGTR